MLRAGGSLMRNALWCLLLSGCISNASSPQSVLKSPIERKLLLWPQSHHPHRTLHAGMCCALPRGDGFRVWYTGNCATGYHICWVDFDARWERVRESNGPCLIPGAKGEFDSTSVFMPCVVDAGDGSLRMYYAAHAEGLFPGKGSSAGVAISSDGGETWTKQGQTLSATGADEGGVGTHCVWRDGPEWRMLYTHLTGQKQRYFLKYAQSIDGFQWERSPENIALDFDGGTSARPCVWKEGDRYRMIYTYRPRSSAGPNRYCIRSAASEDGQRFTDCGLVLDIDSQSQWDNQAVCYGWLVPERDVLFYSGNEYGQTGFGVCRIHCTARR